VAWLGLREAILPFERQPRAGGETKYPPLKMLRFAWTAVSSFSALPLRLSTAAGVVLSGAGFIYLLYVVYLAFWTHSLVPGWASVVVLQCIFSGMILLALGMIGDYVARSYEESKGRPLYIVTSTFNVMEPETEIARASILAQPDFISGPVQGGGLREGPRIVAGFDRYKVRSSCDRTQSTIFEIMP
jgi:dolichol-phosphate mannosyltransferase